MKAAASPLELKDFAITQFDFQLTPFSEEGETDVMPYFRQYELDIDFEMDHFEGFIRVFIKAKVNHGEKQLPGYSIVAEAGCFFKFNEAAELTEEIKKSLGGFSTIYIALNSLRGLISSFTANAPFGRYILPSIDLNDLINQKRKVFEEAEEKNQKATGSKKSKKVKAKR